MSTTRAWAFLSSQCLSILGSALSGIAIPWLLLEKDPGAGIASMVLSSQSLAAIVAMVFGSLMIDRIDKRRFCMASDLTLCLGLVLLVALYFLNRLTPLAIVLFVVLHAIMGSLAHAAETALIPQIAASGSMSNHRINGLIGVFHNGGDLLGPVLGGLIITSAGLAGALCLDSASFLASFLLYWFFIPASTGALPAASEATTPPAASEATAPAAPPVQSIKAEMLGGVKQIIHDPLLRCVTFASAVINMVLTPFLSLLILVLVKSRSGSALDAGVMLSCFGVGGFLASALFALGGERLRRHPLPAMMLSLLAMLGAFVALPLLDGNAVLPCLLLIGLCVGYLGPLEQTMVQDHAQQDMLGRVLLAYSASRTLLVPLGYAITAMALAQFGVKGACFAMALLLLLPALNLGGYLLKRGGGLDRS
jgi:predicted MFS family arabinose efflux permease